MNSEIKIKVLPVWGVQTHTHTDTHKHTHKHMGKSLFSLFPESWTECKFRAPAVNLCFTVEKNIEVNVMLNFSKKSAANILFPSTVWFPLKIK